MLCTWARTTRVATHKTLVIHNVSKAINRQRRVMLRTRKCPLIMQSPHQGSANDQFLQSRVCYRQANANSAHQTHRAGTQHSALRQDPCLAMQSNAKQDWTYSSHACGTASDAGVNAAKAQTLAPKHPPDSQHHATHQTSREKNYSNPIHLHGGLAPHAHAMQHEQLLHQNWTH